MKKQGFAEENGVSDEKNGVDGRENGVLDEKDGVVGREKISSEAGRAGKCSRRGPAGVPKMTPEMMKPLTKLSFLISILITLLDRRPT